MDPSPDPFINIFRKWLEVFMRRSMQDFIQSAKRNGISMSQVSAMFYLRRNGLGGVSDIAESLGVTSAAVSQLLERLVQQGFILRTEDPDDRRLKQIVLTDKGSQLLDENMRARQKWLMDLAASLTPSEKEQVSAALEVLIEKAGQLTQVQVN